ncbi:hypothetical protein SLEP1_g49163 [Rubroshorea leprosula]|uniref:RNase H type-1 domain-containing protein n=1 Tax=Rubroshorea leprosula TaxID=152421 RepID=A0AAV5LW23_9ROSI|nr:hypothetical protein SLEP1_g49163 [Rubroshorea leprosula]
MVNTRSVRVGNPSQPLGQGQVPNNLPSNLPPPIPNMFPLVDHAERGDENQLHNSAHNSASTANQDVVTAQLATMQQQFAPQQDPQPVQHAPALSESQVEQRDVPPPHHTADSIPHPLNINITLEPYPVGFKIPQLETYDGTKDLNDHIHAFYSCNARTWYYSLPPRSISSYTEMASAFATKFSNKRLIRKTTFELMRFKQRDEESLKNYMSRFNDAVLEVSSFDQAVGIATMISSLNHETFRDSLIKHPTTTFNERDEQPRFVREQGSQPQGIRNPPNRQGMGYQQAPPPLPPPARIIHMITGGLEAGVQVEGILTMNVAFGSGRTYVTPSFRFLVVKMPSSFKVVIGRPTLIEIRAVVSQSHLCMKFPTPMGIATLIDMPGIPTSVSQHKLSTNLLKKPMAQKRRLFGGERLKVIKEKVEKLLQAGFVKRVDYCEWVTNPMLACPKDYYPMPNIDKLVEAASGNERLSLLDAYSGYHQVTMAPEDKEKTSFYAGDEIYCYMMMSFGLKNATEDHLNDLKETFNNLKKNRMRLNPAKCIFGVEFGKFLGFMVSRRRIEVNSEKIKAVAEMEPPKSVKDVQRLIGRVAALHRFISKSTDKCLSFFKIMRLAAQKDESGKQKKFEWNSECQAAFGELKSYLSSPPLLTKANDGEILYLYLVELGEFEITFQQRSAIQAQALVDFIVECTPCHSTPNPKPNDWTLYVDGASSNKGLGAGALLIGPDGYRSEHTLKFNFDTTNNMAEYEALILGLQLALELKVRAIQLYNGIVPEDKEEEMRLRKKASRYTLVDGVLYKRSFSLPLLRCLNSYEAEYALQEMHEGVCGSHIGARTLAHKVLRQGYYWPNMYKDVTQFVQRIKLQFTLVYHPESDGMVESVNKAILEGIKPRLEQHKARWADELNNVL